MAEVEVAGAVEGFLRGADGDAGGQDLVLVFVAAGQVETEPPGQARVVPAYDVPNQNPRTRFPCLKALEVAEEASARESVLRGLATE